MEKTYTKEVIDELSVLEDTLNGAIKSKPWFFSKNRTENQTENQNQIENQNQTENQIENQNQTYNKLEPTNTADQAH